MSTINTLGPVGFNPTGEYDETKSYQKLDVVLYEGSSYVALQDSIGQEPTNTTYWQELVNGKLWITYDSVEKTLNIAIAGRITYDADTKNLVFKTV